MTTRKKLTTLLGLDNDTIANDTELIMLGIVALMEREVKPTKKEPARMRIVDVVNSGKISGRMATALSRGIADYGWEYMDQIDKTRFMIIRNVGESIWTEFMSLTKKLK